MKMCKYIKKKNIWILIIIFLAILFLQSMIFMSFDDYGYGSLSYVIGNKYNSNGGVSYSIIDIFKFLKETYFEWAGRILGQFMLIQSLQIGEWFIKLIQAIIIFITLLLGTKVFCNNKHTTKMIFTVAIFFCIPVKILKLSLFWYAASTIYFWPFLFFIIGLYLIKKEINGIKQGLLFILGVMAGLSQEQVGLAFCAFLFIVILWDYIIKNKTIEKQKIIFFIGIIIGYLILVIAPGNFVRMSDSSSRGMLEKGIISIFYLSLKMILPNLVAMSRTLIYTFIIGLVSLLLYEKSFEIKWIEKSKKVTLILLIFTQILLLVDTNEYNNITLYIVQIINIVILIIGIFMVAFLCENELIISLIVAAITSLIPIIVSPYFVDRMLLPMYVFYVFLLISLLEKAILDNKDKDYLRKMPLYIILFMGICGYSCITYGYFQNSIPKNLNNHILKQVKNEINNGKDISSVYLYKNINEIYTGTQPYEIDYTHDIKSYFDIPEEIQIIFEPLPEKNVFKLLYMILKDGNKEIQNLKFISEIDTINHKKDISNKLVGAYALEAYSDNSFYWIQRNSRFNIKNKDITKKGLKIILDIPKENILQANKCINEINTKIYINNQLVKDLYLQDGYQEINISSHELLDIGNDKYIINIKSDFDFSPSEIGINRDSRRFFAKVYYVGANI
ncbi:hypothetical protein FC961_03685 [Clostridium botulinum]|nr:hypothetical protein [Clostridium botulinum]NFO91421.1 hypothetical protein [Clostridium botulinum]